MKTMYQVQSRLTINDEWLDDHLPFDSEEDAVEYINRQPKCFDYRINIYEEPETDSEWLDFNDAWDAIGGDWQG